MKTSVIQTAFIGGELAPELAARVDIEKYSFGARSLKNFFVRDSGGISNRPGMRFIDDVRLDAEACRLIPFTFNVDQSYALAFQNKSMRVFRDGAAVVETPLNISGATQANPVVITTATNHDIVPNDEVFISGIVGMTELNNRFFQATWILGTALTITGATQANPVVLTVVGHDLTENDRVYVSGVGGMTELNDNHYTVSLSLSSSKNITGATQANPVVLTSTDHLYDDDQRIYVSGVGGMTELNGNTYTVKLIRTKLRNITGATQANPVAITAVAHGYQVGQRVIIEGVGGMTEINDRTFLISLVLSSSKNVTGATQANPVVITTSTDHGYSDGNLVLLQSLGGMTEVNGEQFTISRFKETAVNISGATQANPCQITTSSAHGYTTGDVVYISGVSGMTELNTNDYTITVTGASTFTLDSTDSTGYGAYTSGGTSEKYDPTKFELDGEDGTGYTAYTSGGTAQIVDPDTFTLNGEDGTGHTAYTSGGTVEAVNKSTFELESTDGTGYTAYTSGGTAQNVDNDSLTLTGVDGTAYTAYTSGGTVQEIDLDQFQLIGEDGTSHTAYVSGGTTARTYTLATPYLEADLFDLKFDQSGDVMTITHPDYETRDLSRNDHDDWSLGGVVFAPEISAPTGVSAVKSGSGTGISYKYAVTAYNENTAEESIASLSGAVDGDLSTSGDKITVSWSSVTDASKYNVYKALDGSEYYGFVGSATSTTWVDRNVDPEVNDSPAMSVRDPFASAGDYPATVTYHQGRRWFAQTDNNPQRVDASASGNYTNFNISAAVRADDAIQATLAGRQINEIRHLVSLGQLIVFTAGAEWLLASSSANSGITPATISFNVQSYWGCAEVRPLVIGNTALFITNKNNEIRDITYAIETDGYTGNDLTVLARHLFEGFTIVDWCYAQSPDNLVACVRSDGKMPVLTYSREHKVWAWTLWETDGDFESVATVSEDGRDAVYAVVKRTVGSTEKRFVERFEPRFFTNQKDAVFLDSSLTLDVPVTVTGLTAATPPVVTAAAHGFANGDLVELDDIKELDSESRIVDSAVNGFKYTVANAATNTFELTDRYSGANVDGSELGTYKSGGEARKCVASVTGFDHFAGETITAVADGMVLSDLTVDSSGSIALGGLYARVHAGIGYESELETLDINPNDPRASTVGRKRQVKAVTFEFEKTRIGMLGPDADNLETLPNRTSEDMDKAEDVFTGEERYEFTAADYEIRNGRFLYRQSDPLPVTILGMVPELDVGGH